MKKFTSVLIGCSLVLAGAAFAQPEPEQSPKKGKQGAEKVEKAQPKVRGENAVKPEATTAVKQHGMKSERAPLNPQNAEASPKPGGHAGKGANVSSEPVASAAPTVKEQEGKHSQALKEHAVTEKTSQGGTSTTATSANTGQSFSTTNQAAEHGQANVAAGAKKKPEPAQVQQIKQQHMSFHAQPKPQQAPAVTFNQSYRIQGSERWQGQQYEVFRAYHPERHDRGWYSSHYNRVELIGGGYYYWNNGYWYPAWGYDSGAEYYAYDGPIYVGHRAEPPDQVIADVQSELQQMGYYQGDVDGLLGPLTRQALTAYQADQGLTPTAAIDEPTLDSLGMG